MTICRQETSIICKKLAITSPTSGGRSVGIVRSQTQTKEFVCLYFLNVYFRVVFSVTCLNVNHVHVLIV
jgi:hypothetical protein